MISLLIDNVKLREQTTFDPTKSTMNKPIPTTKAATESLTKPRMANFQPATKSTEITTVGNVMIFSVFSDQSLSYVKTVTRHLCLFCLDCR